MQERPIDALDKARGKRILIKLKNGEELTGILRAFDLHLNIWIDEAELTKSDVRIKLGTVLIRGDTIVYASPIK